VQHLREDLGAVRVYTGAEADLLSEQAGRMAFAVGDALIFGQGAYRPETPEGQRLLAEGLAAALAHGPGALGPTPRALSVTDGGGGGVGGHGEGVGAVRPLSAASPFAGTGATGGHTVTAAQLLPLIRQVYAHPRRPVHPVHGGQGDGALPLASATLGSGAPGHMQPKDGIGVTGPESGTAPGSSAQQRQNIANEYALYNDLAAVVGRDRIYNANDPAGLQKARDKHGYDWALWIHTAYEPLDLVIPYYSDWEYVLPSKLQKIVGQRGSLTSKGWAPSEQDAMDILHGIARGFGLDALFYQERQVFANISALWGNFMGWLGAQTDYIVSKWLIADFGSMNIMLPSTWRISNEINAIAAGNGELYKILAPYYQNSEQAFRQAIMNVGNWFKDQLVSAAITQLVALASPLTGAILDAIQAVLGIIQFVQQYGTQLKAVLGKLFQDLTHGHGQDAFQIVETAIWDNVGLIIDFAAGLIHKDPSNYVADAFGGVLKKAGHALHETLHPGHATSPTHPHEHPAPPFATYMENVGALKGSMAAFGQHRAAEQQSLLSLQQAIAHKDAHWIATSQHSLDATRGREQTDIDHALRAGGSLLETPFDNYTATQEWALTNNLLASIGATPDANGVKSTKFGKFFVVPNGTDGPYPNNKNDTDVKMVDEQTLFYIVHAIKMFESFNSSIITLNGDNLSQIGMLLDLDALLTQSQDQTVIGQILASGHSLSMQFGGADNIDVEDPTSSTIFPDNEPNYGSNVTLTYQAAPWSGEVVWRDRPLAATLPVLLTQAAAAMQGLAPPAVADGPPAPAGSSHH